jgi:iron complex outermembrane recepter protein
MKAWRELAATHVPQDLRSLYPLQCSIAATSIPLRAQVGQNGTVSGFAVAADGSPLAGANVILSAPEGFTRKTATEVDGTFLFADLPSGSYTVQSTLSGFASFTQNSVSVAVGRNTQLTLKLVSGSRRASHSTAR